jgi:ATP:corrinoid adenosyltransferase
MWQKAGAIVRGIIFRKWDELNPALNLGLLLIDEVAQVRK